MANQSYIRLSAISAVLAALTLSPLPATAEALCNGHRMPPQQYRQEPNVRYDVRTMAGAKLDGYCATPTLKTVWGCSHVEGKVWVILIRDGLAAPDRACIIIYEKAHLPPNKWMDALVESPATIKRAQAQGGWHISY